MQAIMAIRIRMAFDVGQNPLYHFNESPETFETSKVKEQHPGEAIENH